jgi:hypothetical protein
MGNLVCRVAWMSRYQGSDGDPPRNSGSYVEETGFAEEAYNFLEHNGWLYGLVFPGWDPSTEKYRPINFDRLGASPPDDSIDGVTIVWVARSPYDK